MTFPTFFGYHQQINAFEYLPVHKYCIHLHLFQVGGSLVDHAFGDSFCAAQLVKFKGCCAGQTYCRHVQPPAAKASCAPCGLLEHVLQAWQRARVPGPSWHFESLDDLRKHLTTTASMPQTIVQFVFQEHTLTRPSMPQPY